MAEIPPGPEDTGPDDDFALAPGLVGAIVEAVAAGDRAAAVGLIEKLHVADLADLVAQIGPGLRRDFLTLVWDDIDKDFLAELGENLRDDIVAELDPSMLAEAVRDLDSDDAVYVLEGLGDAAQSAVVEALEPEDRAIIAKSLAYPDYSAGRLMQPEFVKAPPFWTVGQMIDEMRASDDLPEQFYDVIVVDPAMKPVGKIPLSRILAHARPVTLGSLMEEDFRTLHVEDEQEDVAYAFNKYHLVSCPVVDDDGRVVGVITIDDAMEVLEDEAEEDIRRLGGLGDEEITDGVRDIFRQRFPWLGVNAVTAVLAASVVSVFEATIDRIVALAILLPIVASMGGNAGTQSLTVAVRALATRSLTSVNARRVVLRELMVGLGNGAAFGIIIGLVGAAWFGQPLIGLVLFLAMVANMVTAAAAGILVPMLLERLGADPAVSSGTFVTTLTDVTGFFAFLGLASVILL